MKRKEAQGGKKVLNGVDVEGHKGKNPRKTRPVATK